MREDNQVVDPARHGDSRNFVESILRHIPGFRGYLEKEYRRESDELARAHLVSELQRAKEELDNYQRGLVDAAQFDALPHCERVRGRLDTLQSRIKGAMQGYSGFFDFVKVDEGVLDDVYEHDLAMAADVGALRDSVEQLPNAEGTPTERIAAIYKEVEKVHQRFDKRSEILEGLSAKA